MHVSRLYTPLQVCRILAYSHKIAYHTLPTPPPGMSDVTVSGIDWLQLAVQYYKVLFGYLYSLKNLPNVVSKY